MRLVAEIESRRRVRGAEAPWTRLSLSVRVRWSGSPGVALPRTLRDRRLVVSRETTAPETYRRGDRLNLSSEETAGLSSVTAPGPDGESREVSLESPEMVVVVDAGAGAALRSVVLAGENSGTVAVGPLRLGVGENEAPGRGGALWHVEGRGDLWKARFGRGRSPEGVLRMVEKGSGKKARVVRTLEAVPGTTLLRDRFEVIPGKKEGKARRPDPIRVTFDLAFEVGEAARLLLPEHDRLVPWRHTPDAARAWLTWAGTTEQRSGPEGGFAAAVGARAVHVLLFAAREVDQLFADSRRDHPAVRLAFARARPPLAREVIHVVGRRAGFAGRRAVAVLAETTDPDTGGRVAHVVAYRRGARTASGRAVLVDGGRERELTLGRCVLGPVGGVWAGRVALESDAAGEVEVRLGRDRIHIGSAP